MYIIIGASSFIGVYTVDEFLKQGCKVVVTGRNNKFKDHYDRLGVEYINLDLTKKMTSKDFLKIMSMELFHWMDCYLQIQILI